MIEVSINAPDDILDVDAYIAGSIQAVNDTVDDTLKDFNASKKDFSERSQFEFEVRKATKPENGIISGSVRTDDENYCRLNDGFIIPEVKGKYMKFKPIYNAKTAKGIITSKGGGPSGNPIRRMSRKKTVVPGRQFDIAIRNANITKFHKRVNEIGGKKNG